MESRKRVFHALDLDRTLLNTPKLSAKVLDVLSRYDAGLAATLHADLRAFEERGESPPLFQPIESSLDQARITQFYRDLRDAVVPDDFLLPGARERIAYAKSRPEWSMGVLTMGEPSVQRMKLEMLNLDRERCLVVDSRKKGMIIASWVLPRGGGIQLPSELGGEIVDTVVFDDDRHIAFEDFPDFCIGNWVNTHDSTTDLALLPPSVARVNDLYESIERLDAIL